MQRKFQLGDKVMLMLIALPGILHFIIFRYIPLGGNIIAFQDYNMFTGFLGSPFVGFKHFVTMFTYDEFFQILKNSILLSLYSIIFGFPAPLILALLLNEVRGMWFKRPVQTLLYMPHFLSWVIVGGIFINLLATKGFVNQFLGLFGLGPYDFVTMPEFFRPIIISVSIWKEIGWGTILFLAALTAINPSLYEAAMVDGANRWRRMWHITLPSLLPTIMVLFLLRIGSVLEANVEQVLIFQNPLNRTVAEIIDTYVYRVGLLSAQFSFSTAIGMFQALVGFILIMLLNQVSKRTTGESIY
ncbi:ABC transporter permease [Paenibacillus sp. MBLB4367]|uniref:ABC transporter permease n=1 Tax=Paenibacillus sp. MBLB4367 TaxID=3384767 RepID=UPI003907FC0A